MDRKKAAIILSGENLKVSLATSGKCDYIYIRSDLLKKIRLKHKNISSEINKIDFSELKEKKYIKQENMFFMLATFREMMTDLFIDDTQMDILEVAQMISMPNVLNINISLTKSHQLKTKKKIDQVKGFAKSVGARVTLSNSYGHQGHGKVWTNHQCLTINISKESG